MERRPLLAAAALALTAALSAQRPAADDAQRLATALNEFAASLQPKLGDAGAPNHSPASIGIALAMLLPGARRATADELASVLRLPADLRDARLHDAARSLLQQLGLADAAPRERTWQLRIANDLWVQKGHPIVPAYTDVLRRAFDAASHELAFRDDPAAARAHINAHIASATNDRIRDLLAPDMVTEDTRVVLTNALWLKARWAEEFYARATKPAPFHLADGSTVDVPMMRRTDHFAYAETPDWQCAVLPFDGHELVFEVMLPRAGKDLAAAERALLAGEHQQGIAANLVAVRLPRFRAASSARLREPLRALGLRTAFAAGAADFTGISPKDQLVLDEVVHQMWIDVNEEGVEAAAATATALRAGSAMRQQPPIEFVADRPFAFALRHRASNLVLFTGRLADPRQAPGPSTSAR